MAAGAGLVWIIGWSHTPALDPFSISPAYSSGFVLTVVALATALDVWAGIAAIVARRLDLAPRIRAAEQLLGRAAVPAILIMIGINVVWYSASKSSVFWLVWGVYCFARQGMNVAGELRS